MSKLTVGQKVRTNALSKCIFPNVKVEVLDLVGDSAVIRVGRHGTSVVKQEILEIIPRAQVSYTTETRTGRTTRKTIEIDADAVEREVAKLSDKGAYSFDVRYEVAS